MTITINFARKTFVILVLAALLCMGVTLAYAAHDDPYIVHACVNNSSGTIKIDQDAGECAENEAALALASESATGDKIVPEQLSPAKGTKLPGFRHISRL